jgi:hypothetical protein
MDIRFKPYTWATSITSVLTLSTYLAACSSGAPSPSAIHATAANSVATLNTPISQIGMDDATSSLQAVTSAQVPGGPTLTSLQQNQDGSYSVGLSDGTTWTVAKDPTTGNINVTDANKVLQASWGTDSSTGNPNIGFPNLSSPTTYVFNPALGLSDTTTALGGALGGLASADAVIAMDAAYAAGFAFAQQAASAADGGGGLAPQSFGVNLQPRGIPLIPILIAVAAYVLISATIASAVNARSKADADNQCYAFQSGDCGKIPQANPPAAIGAAPYAFCGATDINTNGCSNPNASANVGYQCFQQPPPPGGQGAQIIVAQPTQASSGAGLIMGCNLRNSVPPPADGQGNPINGSLYTCTQVTLQFKYESCRWWGLGLFGCSDLITYCAAPVCKNLNGMNCTGFAANNSPAWQTIIAPNQQPAQYQAAAQALCAGVQGFPASCIVGNGGGVQNVGAP